jgi:hypothetical protein
MSLRTLSQWLLVVGVLFSVSGCVSVKPYDYSEFRKSRPTSILVLPPVNQSPDIKASVSVLSQATLPLAESGYYVVPVGVMSETFRQNGLTTPEDIQATDVAKLRNIFGADAALYIVVTSYGSSYKIISSDTVVTATAKLVDLRSGSLLWEGGASASSAENRNNNQAGLVGLLVQAVVEQIVNTTTNQSHIQAGVMDQRLVGARLPNGMLYGPRSPHYSENGN